MHLARWLRLSTLVLLVTACDDLNKPLGHPKSPSFPPESSSSSSSTGGVSSDGGTTPDGGPSAPAPTITPQPGDIQI